VDDNLAQELLYEQFITDIAVDGANNKWIGTADSGLFCLTKWAGNQVSFYDKYLLCLVMLLMILI
jgi:hypothetical protein